MDIIVPTQDDAAFEAQAKADALTHLDPLVQKLMAEHIERRRLWFSSDFLPADEAFDEDKERALGKLRERARGLTDPIRVAVALNLITEEGLPHFHHVLARHVGEDEGWRKWTFMWTAEEDRHGAALRDYIRDARLFHFREIEEMQYSYIVAGWSPDWNNDPYRLLVYTSLQERATQWSHRNTGRLAGTHEPVLMKILAHIATDESRHFSFYRAVFQAILDLNPNEALQSALSVIPRLQMPGLAMPRFREMADVARRAGIYGPMDYANIVEEAIEFWGIAGLKGLNAAGRKAQEKIMGIPARLKKLAEYVQLRSKAKSFSFSFIHDRVLAME
ncbi:MAG: acyl-ACP desaturase [Planctomycetota bacterium]